MASSLYSNAQHVDFDSVLAMDDPGMISMFEALEASGLRGFLGCPAVVYEDALVDFFENASVRNGVVFSTVGGQIVKISEKLFAESFELPVEGLGDLSEMPKDSIFDARSIVSLSGEQINLSGKKNQMKMPYRLLCDIVAKAISVKAGSFNAITVEKFSLMTAVVCGVKMNWAKFLFGILKKMVAVKTKQAKGFAVQISLLLATFPAVDLGEASAAEEIKEAEKKKVVTKKRTAADIEAAVPKKKRTSKKRSLSSISSLEMVVAEEALVVEPLDVEEPRCSSADAVDMIIQQVLDETRADEAPADTTEAAVTEEKNWFDLPYEDIVKQWETENPVVTASDTEGEDVATAEVAPADEVQQVEDVVAPFAAEVELSEDEKTSLDDILLSIPVDIPLPSTCMEVTQIKMGQMIKIPGVTKWTWFLKQLPSIPAEDKGKELLSFEDSFAVAPRVQLALEQQQTSSSSSSSSLRFDQSDIHATASSQPTSFPDFSATLADFQATLSEQLFDSQSNISSKLHKIEQSGVSRGVTLLATGAWLQPESQGDWLFTVGGGRLRLIRSTTGRETHSSACTRRPDEISTDGFSSKDSIGYPRMSASGESSTTMHRLLHASGSHPIPQPNDPKTNQYNQDLGLIHSTNGNHLESPNEGSSIDHQVTIYLHAQNITMFPTNETWVFSQLLCWRLGAWLRPVSRGNRHFTVGGGRLRQSGPRSEGRLLHQPALEGLTRSARTDSPRKVGRNKFRRGAAAAAAAILERGGDGGRSLGARVRVCCNE
ncbi:dystroglycan-like [Dorcoceras hygrometricum]|uniref:Dystroglycan-like n=1 Tax=Dorcoceras hygrometricum TaxID=472368 RepID=A0A2Z7CZQ5_9LAMI|nr:dystroglycan-like [Dorcoceras hygrometricum]